MTLQPNKTKTIVGKISNLEQIGKEMLEMYEDHVAGYALLIVVKKANHKKVVKRVAFNEMKLTPGLHWWEIIS